MIILAVLAVIALAVWCYLALGHGWFWRTDVRLPPAGAPAVWPGVAVVVPARDEADILPDTLPSLLAQDYPGPWRLVLVNDRSSDGTAATVRELACQSGWQPRIVAAGEPLLTTAERESPLVAAGKASLLMVAGSEPPAGWTGKLWALQQGLGVLGPAPDLVLFTDADIAHPPDSLRRLVAAAQAGGLDAVSLMARLPANRRWERLLIPAFVYFFAQLYPFRRVNRAHSRTAAAAGGCLLVRRATLERAGGLERIRGAVIDDVAVARLIKRAGGRIWLGLAGDVRSCRPYARLADVWGMVARSAFCQLRYSYLILVLTVAGLALIYLVPPIAALAGGAALLAGGGTPAAVACTAGAAAWLIMAATYVPMLRYHGRPPPAALLLPLAATLYLLMTADSARRHLRHQGAAWKGRHYSGPPRRLSRDGP